VELATEEKPEVARRAAGLYLKNLVVSKNDAEKKELAQRWMTIAVSVRERVKGIVSPFVFVFGFGFGLVWFGLVWFGLVWFGLFCLVFCSGLFTLWHLVGCFV